MPKARNPHIKTSQYSMKLACPHCGEYYTTHGKAGFDRHYRGTGGCDTCRADGRENPKHPHHRAYYRDIDGKHEYIVAKSQGANKMNQIEELNKAVKIAEKAAMGLLKSHVSAYTRQDGTMVQEHEDSRPSNYKQASDHAKKLSAKANKTNNPADHAAAAEAHVKAFDHAKEELHHSRTDSLKFHNESYHHHNDRAGEFRE